MMTSCLLIVMWQVKKKKENFNFNLQNQKKCHFPNFQKIPLREWDVGYVCQKIVTIRQTDKLTYTNKPIPRADFAAKNDWIHKKPPLVK